MLSGILGWKETKMNQHLSNLSRERGEDLPLHVGLGWCLFLVVSVSNPVSTRSEEESKSNVQTDIVIDSRAILAKEAKECGPGCGLLPVGLRRNLEMSKGCQARENCGKKSWLLQAE